MSSSDWIAVAAVVAAWLAAWFAFRSARASQKSYELAFEQDLRRQPAVDLYLADSHFRALPERGCRVYVFDLVITNRSDGDNAVRELRLTMDYRRGPGPRSNFFVSHNPVLAADLPGITNAPLQLPCQLSAHAVLVGTVLFSVPDELVKASEIESHTLAVIDSHGFEVSREILFLRREAQ